MKKQKNRICVNWATDCCCIPISTGSIAKHWVVAFIDVALPPVFQVGVCYVCPHAGSWAYEYVVCILAGRKGKCLAFYAFKTYRIIIGS